jgi:A/G-specific adenine glycosylase
MTLKNAVKDQTGFQNKLLDWFDKHKRNLPWRNTSNWYPVFLSEFLLQQTQVEQALPYYHKFIDNFPDIITLSRSSEQKVLTLWAGLGYYARAKNLLKAAKVIVENYKAEFPKEFKQALSLPGIGKYTASAILSIAYEQPYAVVDGNVIRVITRIFAIEDDIRNMNTQKHIQHLCDQLLFRDNPGDFNEALMELGATICRKKNPDCPACPIRDYCAANAGNKQSYYPNKSAAPAKKKIFHYICIFLFENRYLLVKRPSSGLLASMWEFPVIEVDKLDKSTHTLEILVKEKYKISGKILLIGENFRHHYTHLDLSYKPVLAGVEIAPAFFTEELEYAWCAVEEIANYPVHNAHLKLLAWIKSLNR